MMQPQYVAPPFAGLAASASLESQGDSLLRARYLLTRAYARLTGGAAVMAGTDMSGVVRQVHAASPRPERRRRRCQTTSSYLQHSALLLLLQPVRKSRSRNNTLSSNLSRSARNRPIQASTSKYRAGRAATLALIQPALAPTGATGGVSC